MGKTLAFIIVVGLLVGIADEDEKPPQPSTLPPDNDVRLAKVGGAQVRRIGLLSYYPNNGGGYTFLEHGHILFYSLPFMPSTYNTKYEQRVRVLDEKGVGRFEVRQASRTLTSIGTSKMPFGGQCVYRTRMSAIANQDASPPTTWARRDIRIAKWTRETADGNFQFSIMDEDRETRLKLKSIVPVLERAEHGR
jgi:hypothetical protein